MSILPIFGCMRSRIFYLSVLASSASAAFYLNLLIPVCSTKSGNLKGILCIPRLYWRYRRFWAQWRGTGTELRTCLQSRRNKGSFEVTSHTSTKSGCLTCILRSKIFICANCLRYFLVILTSGFFLSLFLTPVQFF